MLTKSESYMRLQTPEPIAAADDSHVPPSTPGAPCAAGVVTVSFLLRRIGALVPPRVAAHQQRREPARRDPGSPGLRPRWSHSRASCSLWSEHATTPDVWHRISCGRAANGGRGGRHAFSAESLRVLEDRCPSGVGRGTCGARRATSDETRRAQLGHSPGPSTPRLPTRGWVCPGHREGPGSCRQVGGGSP